MHDEEIEKLAGESAHHHDDTAASDARYDEVPVNHLSPVYTCPMHPEGWQTHSGSCQVCGIGLELEAAAMENDCPLPGADRFHPAFVGWRGQRKIFRPATSVKSRLEVNETLTEIDFQALQAMNAEFILAQ